MKKKYQLPEDAGKKWINALRSGNYEKHEGALMTFYRESTKCYCSIGVYCMANGFDIEENGYTPLKNGTPVDYYKGDLGIPRPLVFAVVDLNDQKHKSFIEIADFLEQNVELI